MKPLDPRLMRYARAARHYIILTAITGTLTAALVVAQAVLISRSISPVIDGKASWSDITPLVAGLALVFCLRLVVLHVQESRAHRAATATITDLRAQVLRHAVALGPRWQAQNSVDTATLLTRGLEDLEPYFTRYLPQLLLAATVTPATVAVMLTQDWPSTIAVVLTIPLIPIFMIMLGRMTAKHSAERLKTMEQLGGQVLDLLAGLPTLKALGREHGPGKRVRALGEAYTATTMSTLRIAFLSGAVLEFITTLSVAIIAVETGFRLLYGYMDLGTALLVIMIAPEVYQPLRQVGFHFHASANGVAAAEAVFKVLDTPRPERGAQPAPDLSRTAISIEHLSVAARGAWAPADLSAIIQPGTLVALTGASGAGKTTTAQVLLSLLPAGSGTIRLLPCPQSETAPGTAGNVESLELAQVDPVSWWGQITWVPQRPAIVPGTVLANVLETASTTGDVVASPYAAKSAAGMAEPASTAATAELLEAARNTGFDEVVEQLPAGWNTRLGQGGQGLSVGQRQRLALTRALLARTPLVVLDEPTAHLDAASEAHVVQAVRTLRQAGRTVVVIAHRAALVAIADQVIQVSSQPDPSLTATSLGLAAADADSAEANSQDSNFPAASSKAKVVTTA
ncbi:thiol reductant ABC exporter subunit CydD [Actinomyces bovis]|uniref:thiol reductant ABC exporter subunit CydD n=1 Tax=Actinomyces bovis TaxID=1658 RepID=UPI0018D4F97A|nr:thiol reductant ABC exporter subunit CydD [Actinomyces bovis]